MSDLHGVKFLGRSSSDVPAMAVRTKFLSCGDTLGLVGGAGKHNEGNLAECYAACYYAKSSYLYDSLVSNLVGSSSGI